MIKEATMSNSKNPKITSSRKQDFIEKVYLLLLTSIPAQTKAERRKLIVKVTHGQMNRHVRFIDYGKCMDFQIDGNGNVSVELKADYHEGHWEQLFEYVDDAEAQADFLRKLKEILSWLIRVFMDLDCFTYHTYMQYVEDNGFITSAHEKMVAEYRMYYGKKRGRPAKEVEC